MQFDLFVYIFLSFFSVVLGLLFFLYPNKVLPVFFLFGLITPTSNQFMSYTSFNGVYFFDYFFLLLTCYYIFSLFVHNKIFKKNLINIIIGFSFLIFYVFLAVNNSVVFDKYLFRDLRPFLTLLYAFMLTSILNKSILSFNLLSSLLITVFIFKILFFITIFLEFSFSDKYYQINSFRYFDASTFVAALIVISNIIFKKNMLTKISKIKLYVLIFLALLVVLISNLRILIFAIICIYILYSKNNFLRKFIYSSLVVGFFLMYSFIIDANRITDANNSDIVTLQIVSRFAPAVEKIIEMKPYEYIYGLGLGTYFEIPWFEYRSLDTKLNTIDSTYLSLFVKYGLFSFLMLILFFRLLLFNVIERENKNAIRIFYLIIFITMSSLYQSGTIFHFLFLNLLFLSLKNENTSRTISINT